MTLAIYISRRFLRAFLMISAIFAAILFLIDMVEQIRRYAGKDLGLSGAAHLAALNLSDGFYTILPLISVLAAVALFLNLSRSSEMVAIRASGRSALRMLAAPFLTAALIGTLAVMILNPLVAATTKRYDLQAAVLRSNGEQTVSLGGSGVWLRQGTEDGGQVVIHAVHASTDATVLQDTTFLIFDSDAGPIRRIEAKTARLGNGEWQLETVKEWSLEFANPEAASSTYDTLSIPSDLTAERIRDGFGQPRAIPIWQLPQYIEGLQRAGFSALRHQVWFQTELARPLLMAAMVLIAAVFTMRHMRGRRTGILVLLALAGGLGLFFLQNMAQVLGDNGSIPAVLAAWGPAVVAILFSLGVLLRLEDG